MSFFASEMINYGVVSSSGVVLHLKDQVFHLKHSFIHFYLGNKHTRKTTNKQDKINKQTHE